MNTKVINTVNVTAAKGKVIQLEVPSNMTGVKLVQWKKENAKEINAFVASTIEVTDDIDEGDINGQVAPAK
jgi:hypothetical protein